MKNVQKIDLGLTGYDELFANDEERKVNKLPRIFDIPISEIDDFPDHPFKVKIDEDMDQLVQSIKERGIITPVTLRPKEDGRYEIVSGHRRKKACELAGLDTVKAEVREMNRDEAIILMVESNLQRSTILPSEKAFSYKMRLEAMNRQGQRTDLTSVPVAQKSTSREQLGKEVGESQDQVRRYIRLTQLIQPLLDLVDEGRIAFRPAVELSYLKKEEQEDLLEEISYADATPSLTQAIKMKRFSQEGKLSNEVIESIMSEEKPNQKEKIRIKYEDARRFIPDSVPYNKTGEYIMKALEYYHRVDKLNDQSRKDDVVTFEELGVDRIFIDEAHYYKNLAAFTKMRNVGGISQTEAMKSSDLYMKCRYLDELTGGRGVVFATGTPISNSMVEMYTMQKYLQYSTLKRNDLIHFDAWASTFGETVTAIELSPEGTGYRAKTRFAKFYNLPELMSMFKETADIQTADMLNLPVPEAHYHNIVLKPSEAQKKMVEGLSDRAERVRNKMVDSSTDNMLLITNDGRKLALDQRLMNDMLPDSETSKVSACADNVFDIWQRTAESRSTQMVFCDLSTPHNDGKFNVYDDLRKKLIEKGIPAEEIAYIHTAETEAKKKELFGKVRSGQIRVLLGSTQKMGAGTNVQTKLVALHHLDCPWRPSDLQQREGRIIRQGNENPEVDIYTYVTENTFDSYLYQLVEGKQKFIGQIMTSKSPVRSAEDIDETALSYAEIKALCAGNPHIKEKMDLDIDVSRLKLLKANHLSQRYALEDQIIKEFPQKIKSLEQRIDGYKADMAQLAQNTLPNEDGFSSMIMAGGTVTDKKAAGEAIIGLCKSMTNPDPIHIGEYRGFDMELFFDSFSREYKITLKHELRHTVTLGTDIFGNIQRLDNALNSFQEKLTACEAQLENTKVQLENAKLEVQKPFPQEDELKTKTARLNELNAMLNLDKRENEIVDGERAEEEPSRSSDDRER